MLTNSLNKWWARSFTGLIWAVAAASVVAWGLRLSAVSASTRLPAPAPLPGDITPDASALARVLGAVAAAPDAVVQAGAASRYALVGVVAARSQQGAALIAVDGKPPRPYRVGGKVDDGLVLQAVEPRRARLGPDTGAPASLTLELPQPQPRR